MMPGGKWRTIGRVALNLLLVVIVLALLAAIWMPAIVGVSPENDDGPPPRSRTDRRPG